MTYSVLGRAPLYQEVIEAVVTTANSELITRIGGLRPPALTTPFTLELGYRPSLGMDSRPYQDEIVYAHDFRFQPES